MFEGGVGDGAALELWPAKQSKINQKKKKGNVYAPAPDLIHDPIFKSDKPRLALL